MSEVYASNFWSYVGGILYNRTIEYLIVSVSPTYTLFHTYILMMNKA